jgi:hypothetical protein
MSDDLTPAMIAALRRINQFDQFHRPRFFRDVAYPTYHALIRRGLAYGPAGLDYRWIQITDAGVAWLARHEEAR